MDLKKIIYHNSLADWVTALAVAAAIFVATAVLRRILYGKTQKIAGTTPNDWDDLAADLIGLLKPALLLVVAVYIGTLWLNLPKTVEKAFIKIVVFAVLFQIGIFGSFIIRFCVNRYRRQKLDSDAVAVTTFSSVGFVLRIILWTILALVILDNLGVNITALATGLGIGGIAVALAVQNILGDLLASFSIVLDKPFVIGDFIIIDDFLGTVENIGLKTTRVRSLSGEQLVFSNADLLNSRIRNFKRMVERRVVFTIGVLYQTPYEKLKEIPDMIRQIIEPGLLARFDRAHFKDYGAYSLNFEVVYWIQSADYNVFMDMQQDINLEIYRRFEEKGIEFAYPTQTVFLRPESNIVFPLGTLNAGENVPASPAS